MTLLLKLTSLADYRDHISLSCVLQATDEVKRLRSEQTDQLLAESGASLKIERDNAVSKLKQVSTGP